MATENMIPCCSSRKPTIRSQCLVCSYSSKSTTSSKPPLHWFALLCHCKDFDPTLRLLSEKTPLIPAHLLNFSRNASSHSAIPSADYFHCLFSDCQKTSLMLNGSVSWMNPRAAPSVHGHCGSRSPPQADAPVHTITFPPLLEHTVSAHASLTTHHLPQPRFFQFIVTCFLFKL